ncbi:CGCGG family rSAM-modified RiPP protein [Halorubrum sp. BOL3-1]|uniref:CGCGG family putative rSAM-modified RiPP protein n=1 Tax=Halorubrum sp. BOL3-1 TaxID=2497325 RepID=UPI001004EE40|nr:CGCGG family rSAM-modified RiPP protein [Halorubrum sp. BOL3-1]QAU14234.1 CGCGG family rSAM-modified RiPP protein [Halorubrum sp. BOL3-1]
MTTSHDGRDHGADPMADHVHENSWSANLEGPEHAADRDFLVRQAIEAVEHTAAGNHVNLVTHGDHGHPGAYLFDALESVLDDDLDPEYVEQCGCGGHVVRVDV